MELVRYPPNSFNRAPFLLSVPFALICFCTAAAVLTFWASSEIKQQQAERAQVETRLQFDALQIRALTRRVDALSEKTNEPKSLVAPLSKTRTIELRQREVVFPRPQVAPIIINGKVSAAPAPELLKQTDAPLNYDSDIQQLNTSVATTHEQLLKLERQSTRHFVEFKLDRSKDFQQVGGLQVQLRKVDQKHSSYNISIMVSGHRLDKSKINMFEPIWIASADNPMKFQLVVNGIAQNQISGYLSEARPGTAYSKR